LAFKFSTNHKIESRGDCLKRSVLELRKNEYGYYHSVFKNNHGRRTYIQISIVENECEIIKCFYIDRTSRPEPKKLRTFNFPISQLLSICETELDKNFVSYELNDNSPISDEELISTATQREKYNILIFLRENNSLKTIFKNRFRRAIYLEIQLLQDRALVKVCRYCDLRGEDTDITPYSIKTIYFDYSFNNLLKIVNEELEGGFTDIVITENHTINLDRPICGSI